FTNGLLPEQDGIPMATGHHLLVCKQNNSIQNGVYTVTHGNASSPFILHRIASAAHRGDFDGQVVEVLEGNRHSRRLFIQQTLSPVIGTADIICHRGALSRNDWPSHQALLLSSLHISGIL